MTLTFIVAASSVAIAVVSDTEDLVRRDGTGRVGVGWSEKGYFGEYDERKLNVNI